MYGDIATEKEINFVMDNLCSASENELRDIFGKDYKQKVIEKILQTEDKNLIKLKATGEAVGIVGVVKVNLNVGGLFFVSTDSLKNGNMFTLLRDSKIYVQEWSKQYKLLYDQCSNKNLLVMKWLEFLRFNLLSSTDEFNLYYKGELNYDR